MYFKLQNKKKRLHYYSAVPSSSSMNSEPQYFLCLSLLFKLLSTGQQTSLASTDSTLGAEKTPPLEPGLLGCEEGGISGQLKPCWEKGKCLNRERSFHFCWVATFSKVGWFSKRTKRQVINLDTSGWVNSIKMGVQMWAFSFIECRHSLVGSLACYLCVNTNTQFTVHEGDSLEKVLSDLLKRHWVRIDIEVAVPRHVWTWAAFQIIFWVLQFTVMTSWLHYVSGHFIVKAHLTSCTLPHWGLLWSEWNLALVDWPSWA